MTLEFNAISGERLVNHSESVYYQLACKLLDLEELAQAPLVPITIANIDDPCCINPADLSDEMEQRLAVRICELTSGMTAAQWDDLDETQRVPWLENAIERLGRENNATPSDLKPIMQTGQSRLTVDIAKKTATLDGQTHDVTSEAALRWLQALVDQKGDWISGKELKRADPQLIDPRTDKLRECLPKRILSLIDSKRGTGSRIRL